MKARRIPAHVLLQCKQPVCINVEVVKLSLRSVLKHPASHEGAREGVLSTLKEDAPWADWWVHSVNGETYLDVLRWETGTEEATFSSDDIGEVFRLSDALGRALEENEPGIFINAISKFHQEYGPLQLPSGDTRPKHFPLAEYPVLICVSAAVARLHLSTIRMKEGYPPPVAMGEGLLRHMKSELRNKMEELQGQIPPEYRGYFLPIELVDGMLGFRSRVDQIEVSRKYTGGIVNAILALTQPLVAIAQPGKQLTMEFLPRTPLAVAVLSLLTLTEKGERKYCACGCGRLVPPGREFLPEHSGRANVKQQVLARYRTRKNEGRISEETYERIKGLVDHLYTNEGIRNKGVLVEAVEELLGQEG